MAICKTSLSTVALPILYGIVYFPNQISHHTTCKMEVQVVSKKIQKICCTIWSIVYAIEFYLCLLGSFQRSSPVIFITLGRNLRFFIFQTSYANLSDHVHVRWHRMGTKIKICRDSWGVGALLLWARQSIRHRTLHDLQIIQSVLEMKKLRMDIGVGKTCFVLMYCLFFQGIHLCNFWRYVCNV